MVLSRITDIRTTLVLIKNLRNKIQEKQHAIETMIGFAKNHQQILVRKNMGWVFSVQKFYSNPAVARHNQCRSGYYTALENLLTYTHKNFDNIMELKSQVHMKNYDVYYLRYRRAADRLNRINKERIRFQNEFVHQYPEVKPFLPGAHHLEPFKFWDKFSF